MSQLCDGAYDVYREVVRKARKTHKCSACDVAIRPGDHYCAVSWVYDGTASGIRRCGSCQTLHLHLRELCRREDDCGMWPDEQLNCGLSYEYEWGVVPGHIEDLPLLSQDERSELLRDQTPDSSRIAPG